MELETRPSGLLCKRIVCDWVHVSAQHTIRVLGWTPADADRNPSADWRVLLDSASLPCPGIMHICHATSLLSDALLSFESRRGHAVYCPLLQQHHARLVQPLSEHQPELWHTELRLSYINIPSEPLGKFAAQVVFLLFSVFAANVHVILNNEFLSVL